MRTHAKPLSILMLLLTLLSLSARAAEPAPAVAVKPLGVLVSEPTYAERREMDLPNGGVMVREVEDTGPAFAAELRVGDLILSYDGVVLEGLKHFTDLVAELRRDRPVPLLVLRGQGEYVELSVPRA